MRQFRVLTILFIFFIFGLLNPNFLVLAKSAGATTAQPVAGIEVGQSGSQKVGEILLKLKNDPEVYKFKFSFQANLAEIMAEYQKRPEVEFVELNYQFIMAAFPNDPDYLQQWYLSAVLARDGWSKELVEKEIRGTKEAVIAILDSGADIDHPDLKENIWQNIGEKAGDKIDNDKNGYVDDIFGWDFVTNTADPRPKFEPGYTKEGINHGTIIAGIAAASGHNREGITGVSWKAKIMPLRVLDSRGTGTVYDVYLAVEYAIANKANIINMSFIGFDYSQTLADVLRRAADAGIVIVAAAGNTDARVAGINLQKQKVYPVCYDFGSGRNFIAGVASVGLSQVKSDFSNFGGDCVDISAPGEKFYSTLVYAPSQPDFKVYYGGSWSGTSLSAPLVSGTAAIVKSLRPDFSNEQIIEIIINSATDISAFNPDYKNSLGRGELNVYQAVVDTIAYQKKQEAVVKSQSMNLVVGLGFGSFPQVKIFKPDFSIYKEFFAYAPSFSGSINVAVGDIDNDGLADIVTGAGFGGGPHVRIFDQDGQVIGQFFAYDRNLRNGVTVAVGDVNGDGQAEIVTGAGAGAKPEVRIFSRDGSMIDSFFAYGEEFLGGVNVAVGDIDNDGRADIVTGAGFGGGPHVRIFSWQGRVLGQFFPFNENSRGGVSVAVGDVNGDGKTEIIAAMQKDAMPSVRVFNVSAFQLLAEFYAFEPQSLNGVNLDAVDIDADGLVEIIAGRGFGSEPQVKIFNWRGVLKSEFLAHFATYRGGVRVAGVRQ